jgi:elongation factor G
LCARDGFREAAPRATPVLLEPIMKLEVTTPDEYMGAVIGDLNRRRAVVKGQDTRGNGLVIKADVPLATMFGYITDLRTNTQGRASSSMEFSHFSPAPRNIAEEVIANSKK